MLLLLLHFPIYFRVFELITFFRYSFWYGGKYMRSGAT